MFGSGTPILFVVFIEVVGVFWFYGVSRLSIWQEKIMINMKHDQRSHQIKVLRRRGADAWTEARPVLETLLAIYQVCPHDFLYWTIWCNTDIILTRYFSPVFLIVILLFTIVDYCSGGMDDFKHSLAAKPSPRFILFRNHSNTTK